MKGHKQKLPEYIVNLCREFRKNPTDTEQMLWECLRDRRLHGAKFRRQHAIGRYIADFCCNEEKLIKEIDGGVHLLHDRVESDKTRQEILESGGYRFIRVTSADVRRNLRGVLVRISEYLDPAE